MVFKPDKKFYRDLILIISISIGCDLIFLSNGDEAGMVVALLLLFFILFAILLQQVGVR